MSRLLLLAFAFLLLVSWSHPALAALTQRQWMQSLVEVMGWSYGLPDEPEDADYLTILDGNRSFRFEAEAIYDHQDIVTVSKLRTFGPFDGSGWVAGISTPTPLRLHFLLPLAGSYRVHAKLRGGEHRFQIGQDRIAVAGKNRWSLVDLGTVPLAAGPQQIEDLLPPDGGLDSIDLDAPPLRAIQPRHGWNPAAPLTGTELAVTSLTLLGVEDALPATAPTLHSEAEDAVNLGQARISAKGFLGVPSGGRWVRAGAEPTTVTLAFKVPAGGVYRLSLRALGPGQLNVRLDGHERFSVTAKAAFRDFLLGSRYLTAGDHRLEIDLPARGGVDLLTLQAQASTPADFRRLAGLGATDEPTPPQIDRLLRLLAAIGSDR